MISKLNLISKNSPLKTIKADTKTTLFWLKCFKDLEILNLNHTTTKKDENHGKNHPAKTAPITNSNPKHKKFINKN